MGDQLKVRGSLLGRILGKLELAFALAQAANVSSPAKLSVANAAAAPAADQGATLTPPGTLLYVQSFRRWFEMSPDSGAAIQTGVVLTAGGGTRRWVWVEDMVDAFWWSQTSWTIDPVAGNDENPGSVARPVQTIAEICRRFRNAILSAGAYTISFLSAPLATDRVDFIRVGLNASGITINGGRTVARSSSFTAGTAGATPATNTRTSLVDSTIANWTVDLNKFVVNTANNTGGWVYLNNGANTARAGGFKDLATGQSSETAPASGNAYQVAVPWALPLGAVDLTIVADTFSPGPITFANFDLQSAGGAFTNINVTLRGLAGGAPNFINCRFLQSTVRVTGAGGGVGTVFANCFFGFDLPSQIGGTVPVLVFGGVTRAGGAATPFSTMILDGNHHVSGGCTMLNQLFFNGGIGFWIANAGFFDSAGDGLTIDNGAVCDLEGQNGGASLLWGAQNAGRGLRVFGCTVRRHVSATIPVITGTGGDFELGSTTTFRPWNEAGGAYGAAVASTWVNFAAAAGVNAWDVQTASCIVSPV